MTNARAGQSVILLAGGLAAVASACGTTTYLGTFDRAPRVSSPIRLEVHNGSGDLIVRAGPPGSVQIRGRVTANGGLGGASEAQARRVKDHPPIRHADGAIILGPVPEKGVSIDYEIVIPAGTHVLADIGSGDCKVRGLGAGLELETGSGNIELDSIAGGVRVTTGSGDIDGRAVAGAVEAETGSGDISFRLTAPGNVRVRTGSGTAEVRGVAGALALTSGSGSVVAEGDPRGPWEVATSSGDVRVALAPASSFELEVTTSSGQIHLGRPVHTVVQGRVDDDDAKHIAGRVGQGGPRVVVETSSGDVAIE